MDNGGAKRFGTFVISSFIAVSTFSYRVDARPLEPITPVEQAARLAQLQHSPWNGIYSERNLETRRGCTRSEIEIQIIDPVSGVGRPLTIIQNRPAKQANVPFVIIIPTIEGVTSLEPNIAGSLCDIGMASAIAEVNDPTFPTEMPSWGYEDVNNRWAIMALRTVLDYGAANPNFDPNRMGMIGLSLGGITAGMLAGIEPQRLRAVVVAVGAGNMPYVLANSDQGKVEEFRTRRMKHQGIKDIVDYELRVRDTMKYDPIYFANRAVRENILMVMAKADTKVPTLVQKELFEAFQRPASDIYSGGHVETLIKMTFWYFNNVASFLQERFGMRVQNILADGQLAEPVLSPMIEPTIGPLPEYFSQEAVSF